MSLSKSIYQLLRTGSTQGDPSGHDCKIVNWDVKNKIKQIFINENSIIIDHVNLQGSSIMKTCLQCVVLFTLLCMSCQLSDVVLKGVSRSYVEVMASNVYFSPPPQWVQLLSILR